MKKIILFLVMMCIPLNINAYSTNAKAVVLMDMDSKRVIYSKNPHYTQSVASISKIMTAIVAIENGKLNKKVIVGDEVLKAYGSALYLKVGEQIKLQDLIYGLMLRSGNDAALVIAKEVAGSEKKFVELMNEKAKKLNMEDTIFRNPHGLDKEDGGNLSSAYDMAILMSYAMKNKEFQEIVKTKKHKIKTNKNVYMWKNKNKLLFNYKYTIGGKTGFTEKARRTLATAASYNDLNLAVITIQDSTDFKDHQMLYEQAFDSYESYEILKKGNISILGENYYNDSELYIKNNFKYPLTLSEKETLILKFRIEKKKKIKSGDKVGFVEVTVGNKKVYSEDIYVKTIKKEKKFLKKLGKFFDDNF